MITRKKDKGILRVFDPLQYPKIENTNVVMNLTIFLESNGLRVGPNGTRVKKSWDKDLECLKKNIEMYDKLNPSARKDFSMELVISINGYVTDDMPIEYLKSIDDIYISNGKIHITVFQRPNIGWQWGALQDIWMKWKDLDCAFWMTQESDCYFNMENWFDVLYNIYKKQTDKICFISGKERTFFFNDPYEFDGPLNKETWKDKDNKILENPSEYDLRHVDPLYYFISRDFLEELDQTFGCFTFAMAANYQLDAIIYGEMGFCQKARALGYKWIECTDVIFGYDEDYEKL